LLQRPRLARRQSVIALFVITIAVVCVGWLITTNARRPPSYKGVSLTGWLEGILFEKPGAEQGVREIGTNAIPFLVEMLRVKHSPLLERVLQRTQDERGQRLGLRPDSTRRWLAYAGFKALGSQAEQATPLLLPLVNDPPTSRFAALSLAAIGSVGLYSLTNALTNANRDVLCSVLNALGTANSDQLFAAALLTNYIAHTNYVVRFVAVQALGGLREQPALAVPALATAVGDTNRAVRRIAIEQLKGFGKAASPAIERVAQATNDVDPMVREAAMSCLQQIQP
jgi:HEAT repeat protein